MARTHTTKSHSIRQTVLSAFRAQKWCEVCSAAMCCAVKMQFECVAFPDSLQRFLPLWRNLSLIPDEVQFGVFIPPVTEGRQRART